MNSPDPHTDQRPFILRFLFPRFTLNYCLRLAIVAAATWFVFSKLLIVSVVNGSSMLPVYRTGDILVCWKLAFHSTPPKQGDVVMITYSGQRVMLLKRVVAVAGDSIEFKDGHLLVNGIEPDAPWANATPCSWNASPITIAPGCVYAVGDNRDMPIQEHLHGEISVSDIVGAPLW